MWISGCPRVAIASPLRNTASPQALLRKLRHPCVFHGCIRPTAARGHFCSMRHTHACAISMEIRQRTDQMNLGRFDRGNTSISVNHMPAVMRKRQSIHAAFFPGSALWCGVK
jgi:hypothetical protein